MRREANWEAVAASLERGEADRAVVRPDVSLPTNGLTVAILREEALIVLFPTVQKLTSFAALKGKTLATIGRGEGDEQAIRTTLAFYDASEQVRILRADEARISEALSDGRVVAVAYVATPGSVEA